MSRDEPEQSPPKADHVLPYRPPEAPPEINYDHSSVSAGCFTAGFFILAGSLVMIFAGLRIGRWSARAGYTAFGVVFALPAAIGAGMRFSRRWGHFGVGLMIGVCVAVVFAALCIWAIW
jgi:hypothetical protein